MPILCGTRNSLQNLFIWDSVNDVSATVKKTFLGDLSHKKDFFLRTTGVFNGLK